MSLYTKLAEVDQTGIYLIINKVNNKRYIGSAAKGFRNRWYAHKTSLRSNTHHSSKLQRAWNKYGEDCFAFKILEFVPPEYCIQREQWWLDLFGTYMSEYGYNICPTAGSSLGRVVSEETKNKISDANKGRFSGEKHPLWGKTLSKETREKMSQSRAGKFISSENPFYGKKHSEETRKKLGKSYILIDPEGNSYVVHLLKEFCQIHNLSQKHIPSVARGRLPHHKGWKVFYYGEYSFDDSLPKPSQS